MRRYINKIADLLGKANFIKYIPTYNGRSFALVWWVIGAFAVLYIVFLFGWGYNLVVKHSADLDAIIKFGTVMVSPAALAAFTALFKGVSDTDGNGIPDLLDKEK